MGKELKRHYLRAPLVREILYEDDGAVLKALTSNISEGGVLLENLPHMPEINLIPLVLDIPNYPPVSEMLPSFFTHAKVESLERRIIRVRAKIVRNFEKNNAIDAIFIPKVGCEFVKPTDEAAKVIFDYIKTFSKNIVYLLSLFESGKRKDIELLRQVSSFLGYNGQEKLLILRQKVLHDYQSLEAF